MVNQNPGGAGQEPQEAGVLLGFCPHQLVTRYLFSALLDLERCPERLIAEAWHVRSFLFPSRPLRGMP